MAVGISLIRMSTFSLVGAVIPVAAAGSLFAGFMSVSNLAYSFSYASGAWLYDNTLGFGIVRDLQEALFGIPGQAGSELSINMLILVGSLAYLLSFRSVHLLPDRKQTLATTDEEVELPGPKRWLALGAKLMRGVNLVAWVGGAAFCWTAYRHWGFDPIAALLMGFFGITILRKWTLDALLRLRG